MRRSWAAAMIATVALAGLGTGSASAAVPRAWAAAGSATIHPGMATETAGAGCTANFVYTDSAGAVYLGQAAHCTGEAGDGIAGSGCATKSLPLGTKIDLIGSGISGTLAYSSWLAMQRIGEKDEDICLSNDFALIRIPAEAVAKVNPSLPVFGGPVGVATGPLKGGTPIVGYGNSTLRGGVPELSPQRGVGLATDESGFYHLAYLLLPGVPGDSGGGYLDGQGRAFGVLISLNTVPTASNGLTDVGKALAYARAHSGIKGLKLVPGTEPFTG